MTTRTIRLLDAPSNLGLRMPKPGVVPGCYKAPGALRDKGLLDDLGAVDSGYVVPPRYDISDWSPGDGVFNAKAMATYTRQLADRIHRGVLARDFQLVLGGDCSILLAAGVALQRHDRCGLVYFDGSADFLRLSQAGRTGAAAGETLALVTGRGQADLTNIDDLGPYFEDRDIIVLGNRDDDEDVANLADAGIVGYTAPEIQQQGAEPIIKRVFDTFDGLNGFWVHLDVDVLDIEVMPAADAPDPGGLQYNELIELLKPLLADDRCLGMNVTIYDPDLDPAGEYAGDLCQMLVAAFRRRTQ